MESSDLFDTSTISWATSAFPSHDMSSVTEVLSSTELIESIPQSTFSSRFSEASVPGSVSSETSKRLLRNRAHDRDHRAQKLMSLAYKFVLQIDALHSTVPHGIRFCQNFIDTGEFGYIFDSAQLLATCTNAALKKLASCHCFVVQGPPSSGKAALVRALQDDPFVGSRIVTIPDWYECVPFDFSGLGETELQLLAFWTSWVAHVKALSSTPATVNVVVANQGFLPIIFEMPCEDLTPIKSMVQWLTGGPIEYYLDKGVFHHYYIDTPLWEMQRKMQKAGESLERLPQRYRRAKTFMRVLEEHWCDVQVFDTADEVASALQLKILRLLNGPSTKEPHVAATPFA